MQMLVASVKCCVFNHSAKSWHDSCQVVFSCDKRENSSQIFITNRLDMRYQNQYNNRWFVVIFVLKFATGLRLLAYPVQEFFNYIGTRIANITGV